MLWKKEKMEAKKEIETLKPFEDFTSSYNAEFFLLFVLHMMWWFDEWCLKYVSISAHDVFLVFLSRKLNNQLISSRQICGRYRNNQQLHTWLVSIRTYIYFAGK